LLGIAATYLAGRALFGRGVGLAAGALLAVAPWHVHLSRVGFEAVSLPALLALAVWQLATGVLRPRRLVLGAALAALATYAYPPAQIFVPLLLAAFALSYRRELAARPRALACAMVAFAVLEIPNAWTVATGANRARLAQTLITRADLSHEPSARWLAARGETSPLARAILSDRKLLVPFAFVWSYAAHLSPRFLFLEGDANPRHHPTRFGACPLFYAPLLAAGLAVLVRRRREPASRWLLAWLALWPVPASLTVEAPHAIRAIPALPALELAAALGLAALVAPLRAAAAPHAGRAGAARRRLALGATAALAALALAETAAWVRYYHGEYRVRSAAAWQAGLQPALRDLARRRAEHPHAVLSGSIFGIHAFALFFGEVDLARIDARLPLAEQLEAQGLSIAAPGAPVRAQPGALWLVTHGDLGLASWRELARIPLPDGSPNLYVVEWTGPPSPAAPSALPRGLRSSAVNAASASAIPAPRAPAPGGPP
jgi:4-amino-4-deoxy-L-arabinose transferase-like glycosyltransferase